MKSLLIRIRNILVSPRSEWRLIQQEREGAQTAVTGYGAVMAALPPCSAVAERILFGSRLAGRQPLTVVFATNLVWYPVILVNMLITSAVCTFVISGQRRLVDLQGGQLAIYSFTPLCVISIAAVVPGFTWLIYAALLYSICLLYLGIRVMTGVGQARAAWHTLASFAVSAVIVGSANAMEYLLESYLTTRVFY